MKIKLLTGIVGAVVHQAGDVIDVTESDALTMTAAGHCEIVSEEETAKVVETEPATETGTSVESQEPATAATVETETEPATETGSKAKRKKFG